MELARRSVPSWMHLDADGYLAHLAAHGRPPPLRAPPAVSPAAPSARGRAAVAAPAPGGPFAAAANGGTAVDPASYQALFGREELDDDDDADVLMDEGGGGGGGR